MYSETFKKRLIELRTSKGVSARDMSLSIGQNPGYINSIESGKALPSMAAFFYICEYLHISPMEFFDTDTKSPEQVNHIVHNLKKLSDRQLNSLDIIIDGLV